MSAGLFGIAGGEQDVTDTIKDTRIGFFCKTENDRITVNNGVTAIGVIVGHRNIACDLRKLIDHGIITPISSIVKMMNTRPFLSNHSFLTERLIRSSRMPYRVLASVDRS